MRDMKIEVIHSKIASKNANCVLCKFRARTPIREVRTMFPISIDTLESIVRMREGNTIVKFAR